LKKIFYSILGSLLIGPAFAKATGGSVVNGGGGLVCPDGVHLFDLFEATIPGEHSEDGLKIIDSTDDVEAQVRVQIAKLERAVGPRFMERVLNAYKKSKQEAVDVPNGISIAPPTDVNNEFVKTGCDRQIQGVASYNDSKNRLNIDRKLYDRMSKTDQAALWVHEAIYKVLRELTPTQDSRLTRKIIGYLFSNAQVYPDLFQPNLRIGEQTIPLSLYINLQISPVYFVEVSATCHHYDYDISNPKKYQVILDWSKPAKEPGLHPPLVLSSSTALNEIVEAKYNGDLTMEFLNVKLTSLGPWPNRNPPPDCTYSIRYLDYVGRPVLERPVQLVPLHWGNTPMGEAYISQITVRKEISAE
jgi:hypothetical protein